MDQNQEVMATLQAKATQESIEDLKAKGKTKVKVIRAKDIAALIQEAVSRTIHDSDLLTQEQVDSLVHQSKDEFRDLQQKWRERDLVEQQKDGEIDRLREEKRKLQDELEGLRDEMSELRQQAREAGDTQAEAAAEGGLDANAMMLSMMQQLMELKTQAQAPAPQAGAAPAGGDADAQLASKLDAIVGSLDKKLESFGKKMGISQAVDGGDVDMSGLFDKDMDVQLESNMDDVKVKSSKGAGIAANLERIKKLKGGG